jgi:hypothetical protein
MLDELGGNGMAEEPIIISFTFDKNYDGDDKVYVSNDATDILINGVNAQEAVDSLEKILKEIKNDKIPNIILKITTRIYSESDGSTEFNYIYGKPMINLYNTGFSLVINKVDIYDMYDCQEFSFSYFEHEGEEGPSILAQVVAGNF